MISGSNIVSIIKDRQCAMRRELDRRGIALKAVSFDSGIPYSTLLSYFPEEGGKEPAQLPASAQYLLCGVIPDDVLSLLLPSDRKIVRVPEDIDHDEMASAMRQYLAAKDATHHPESPAKRDIADCEDQHLRGLLTVVAGGIAA